MKSYSVITINQPLTVSHLVSNFPSETSLRDNSFARSRARSEAVSGSLVLGGSELEGLRDSLFDNSFARCFARSMGVSGSLMASDAGGRIAAPLLASGGAISVSLVGSKPLYKK